MKVRITKLKAAWPDGAKVGDVLELASVPAWAVGKCEVVGDEAVTDDGTGEALPTIEAINERVATANRAAAGALQLAEEARAQLADAQAALQASTAEADELRKQLADAQAALASAQSGKSGKR